MKSSISINRREFLAASAALGSGLALPQLSFADASSKLVQGKAEHVISVWLGGGMSHVDTFDPKRKGDPKKKQAGSYYNSIETAVPGVRLCEHLPKLARLMDRVTAVRSVHHEVIDEHAAATNRMHTGRPVSGTITYPSPGSIIALACRFPMPARWSTSLKRLAGPERGRCRLPNASPIPMYCSQVFSPTARCQ